MHRTWPPDRFASRADAARQALRDFGGQIAGLTSSMRPAPGCLGGWERFDDRVTTIRIVYAGAGPAGSWASVESSRWAGARVSPASLRSDIEHHMRLRGEHLSGVEWTHGDTTLTVDGQAISAEAVRSARWWAAWCDWGDLEIRILTYDWDPGPIGLETVTDVEPLLVRPRPTPRLSTREPDEPQGERSGHESGGEPHRALVDVVLRASLQQTHWLADGGPMPRLPADWSPLWRAAVRRQIELTEQTAQQAEGAVQSTVAQLSSLQHCAAWFRDDGMLRERAIAETLLYGTALSADVASRQAQVAWQRHHRAIQPSGGAEPEAFAARRLEWISAWAAWSRGAGRVGGEPITGGS